jgi:hypothetical protein
MARTLFICPGKLNKDLSSERVKDVLERISGRGHIVCT